MDHLGSRSMARFDKRFDLRFWRTIGCMSLCLWLTFIEVACGGRWTSFHFRSPDNKRWVSVSMAARECRIALGPDVWTVEKPVNVAWVGFSSNGQRVTVLTCSGDGDFSTTVQRLEYSDLWKAVWPAPPADFAESDRDLVQSLRLTFDLAHFEKDSRVLAWFCEGDGENELRNRGAWPTDESQSVLLPDRARRGARPEDR